MPVFKRVTCWFSNNMLHLFAFISLDLQEPWSSYYFKTEKHQAFCFAVVFLIQRTTFLQMDIITLGVNLENGLGSFTHRLPASCRNYHQLNVQKSAPTPGDPDVTPPGGKGPPSLLWVCALSSITTAKPEHLPGSSIRLWAAPHRHRQINLVHPCDAQGKFLDAPSGKGEPKLFQRET